MSAFSLPSTPRQKIIITTSLTALTILALTAFITWPSIREIRRLNNEIDAQRLELEELYYKGQSLKETLEAYNKVKPTIGSLDRVYVERGQELSVITTLEQVADTTNVKQTIKTNETDKSTKTMPLQLELMGDLAHIIRYLGGIEALDLYVNIDTIRLGSTGRVVAKDVGLSTLIIGNAFYKP